MRELISRQNSTETLAVNALLLHSVTSVAGLPAEEVRQWIQLASQVDSFRIELDSQNSQLRLLGPDLLRSAPISPSANLALLDQLPVLLDAASTRALNAELQRELEETNTGVLALYAELDDRAIKLKRADELKSRFLSYASHELRTPLNGIIGLARLLAARKMQGEELKQLNFILQAAQEMRAMVDDLLDLAKVEAGRITVHASEVGLELIFGALRGMFRPLAHSTGLEIHFEDTSAIPAIYTDEGKVVQILRNFLSNALKFTETGSIRVWAELGSADNVCIRVQDTGIGIALEDQERIFDEFTQVENPLQRRSKGTGLGLPLCKRLAELLKGKVAVQSTPGQGSIFTLEVPLLYVPDHEGATMLLPMRPFTVLHVEDDEIDRYLVEQLLQFRIPHQLLHAADGQSALEIARLERPDLILLDLNLPRISGPDVLRALRSAPETKSIAVAILSASTAPLDEELRQHAIAVLSKDALADAAALAVEAGPPPRIFIRDAL